MAELRLWRHPRAQGTAGRCIGRTDLAVDPRRAKRLAHRIRTQARRHGWPRVVWTSPLARCRDVGRWLRRWGWRHRTDPRLCELGFGEWDGHAWRDVPHREVAAWEADFFHHAPGGGESLQALALRLDGFLEDAASERGVRLVVAHAGPMQWLAWRQTNTAPPTAAQWPPAPRHGEQRRVPV